MKNKNQKKIKSVPDWYEDYRKELKNPIQSIKHDHNGFDEETLNFFNAKKSNLSKKDLLKKSKERSKQMAIFKKRSAKERQEYHFEQSKKGSYDFNPTTGEYVPNSDFKRGVHLGKAQMIQKQRMNTAKYFNRKKRKEIAAVFE